MSGRMHRDPLAALAAALHGHVPAGAAALQSWCRPEVVQSLRPGGSRASPRVDVVVADGWPLALVPARIDLAGGSLRLRAGRAPRLRLQAASCSNAGRSPELRGTVGAFAGDRHDPRPVYALTAGHVLGASVAAAFDDEVSLTVDDGAVIAAARLAEWSTPLARGRRAFRIDAAIAALGADTSGRLAEAIAASLPARIAPVPAAGGKVRVHAAATVTGMLVGVAHETEVVIDIKEADGTVVAQPIRLAELWLYRADERTQPGDSGAGVRDADDALVGLHCAFADDAGRGGANAALTPIGPVLEHFGIVPLTRETRSDSARLAPRPRPDLRAALPRPPIVPPPATASGGVTPRATRETTIDTLARTLWGEARGEGQRGMEAVACVIRNREARPGWWGRDIVEICLKPSQFSAWNPGTASRAALRTVTASDPSFALACEVATRALDGDPADFTRGALHYHAAGIALPRWAKGRLPCFTLGRHVFYADLDGDPRR